MDRQAIQEIRTTKRLDEKLLKSKGAVGVDVEHKQVKGQKTDTFSITVYVEKKLGKEQLSANEAVPQTIEGIPTDVVEAPNIWPSRESSERMAAEVKDKQPQTDVLVGGLCISNQYNINHYGTLGIVVTSNNTPTALSCAHVMVYPNSQPQQGIIEPCGRDGGTYPGDSIGNVSLWHYGENNVDVALTPISDRASTVWYDKNSGKINGWGPASIDMGVKKTGATTGHTAGVVKSTTLTWIYSTPLGRITLTNQIKVEGGDFAGPGDSGSVVIDRNTSKAVGMIVSGDEGNFTVCENSADLKEVIPA